MTDIQRLAYLIDRLHKLPTELAGIEGENVKENLYQLITHSTGASLIEGAVPLTPSREDVDKKPVYWLLKLIDWAVTYALPLGS